MWAIEVHLDGCGVPLELCRCERIEGVSAVVLALGRARETRPITIRVVPDPPGQAGAAEEAWPEAPL